GTTTNSSVPIQVRGAYGAGYLNGVSAIGGGRYVSMAVMASGLAHTWGYNDCGQLGIGSAIIQSAYPRQAINLTDVSAINGGWSHTAALKKDGTAWCWGDNDYGQLGNNTTTDAYAPVQVKGPGGAGFLSGLAGLDAGRYHNAALKSDGTVWTWGYNYYGQLGDTTTANRYVPVAAQCPVTYSSAQIKAQVSIAEMPDVARAFNEYPVFEVATPDLQALTNWNLPDGRYVVHVRAANNVSWSPWSAGAPLIVDATPPTVSLDTVTVGQDGVLNAAASAADNLAGVAKVVFQANGIIVEDAAAPYTADWDTAGWPGTVHTVTAQAFDRAGNPSTVASADISLDKAPPVTAHDYQHDGEWVNTPVTIVFTATDVGSGVAGTYYRINGGADQSGSVLNLEADGEYTVEFWSVDCANNTETPPKTVSVKIDRTPPVITAEVTPPPNAAGWHDADATVTFSAADALSGVLSLSPQTATVSAEGAGQQVTAEAVDSAGNTATHTVTINLDRTPPIVASLQPLDGCWISTQRPTIEVVVDDVSGIATYTLVLDGAPVTSGVIVNGNRLQYMPDYDLSTAAPHAVQVQVTDRVGLSSATVSSTFRIDPAMPPLPPDPKEVAPPLDSTVFTDLASATSFLYTEENPIQTGVAPGTIEPARAAVLRGRVLGADGFALPGVTVSVLGHPEYGQTVSRVDGLFDLAVNGGGVLTLRYERPGYLPAQRQVDAPWQDYVQLPDVALKQLDSQVTTVDLSQTGGQVARGSVVTDADGTRQATLFFPEGVQAAGYPSTLHIRATEYTVGENGPKAMPAELPPTVAYTYCVELSADEAAGGSVQFDRPVYFYVENFLNFPVGTEVPAGYYDYAKAAWIPSKDGRVIRILGATEGLAEVDVSGTGRPADAATLAGLGFTDAERRRLAETYNPGQSIWRVPVSHFSPWDFNWPFGPPPGAKGPQLAKAAKVCGREDNSCLEEQRSTIEIQNQILRETIGIAGTPYTLNYASDRTAGRKAEYSVKIPLSDDQPPPGLKRIDLEVRIAGRTFAETFAPLPNQAHIFTWDGRDVYGRELQGMQPAKVRIGYTYDAVYYSTQNALENSFGTVAGVPIAGSRARQEITLWEEYETSIGTWQVGAYGLGGWTLDVQHFYDPSGRVLYLGDGSRRSAGN
ncbi:MAG: OmpL47-type beta-barrel domain-containing protein, partial [Bacteroidota bacterium]